MSEKERERERERGGEMMTIACTLNTLGLNIKINCKRE